MGTETLALTHLIGASSVKELLGMAQARGLEGGDLEEAMGVILERFIHKQANGDDSLTKALRYKLPPVTVKEFIQSKFYMGKGDEVYAEVMDQLVELNSGKYDEAVLTGGIGSGKTTVALYSQAYQLYLLSVMRSPHAVFGLDSSSEIKIVFQNLNIHLARGVDYARFRDMIERSPYFQRHFMFNKDVNSKLQFPNRIEVEPVSGSETASIGQNVIGGIIDEVNFMSVSENSARASDGGTYDQAIELYNTIARRRKSRFMKAGQMPGLLCLVSSKKTPGQFTDRKEDEAKTNPRIFVYNKRVWDIKPSSFNGQKFQVFVGDETRKPRIYGEDELVPANERDYVDHIPIEFISEFKDDITKALRDIAGRSTLAISPFMPDMERVTQNFGKRKSLCIDERVDFTTVRPRILPTLITNRECKRFVHLDLAIRGDSAGVVIGHVPRFTKVKRDEVFETLPVIEIDLVLEVYAPKGGEIEFSNIRRLLYKLREMGLPINWVTLDSFQSVDTMQILRSEGFITGYQSMDTTMVPYLMTKTALYDGRVPMGKNQKLQTELLTLERDFGKNKIDHNAHGSKDLADALAGVVYGLTMRKEVWLSHGVNPVTSPSVAAEMKNKVDYDPTDRGQGMRPLYRTTK